MTKSNQFAVDVRGKTREEIVEIIQGMLGQEIDRTAKINDLPHYGEQLEVIYLEEDGPRDRDFTFSSMDYYLNNHVVGYPLKVPRKTYKILFEEPEAPAVIVVNGHTYQKIS